MLSLTANALPLTFAVSYLSCQMHSTKRGRLREGAESYAKALASDILR